MTYLLVEGEELAVSEGAMVATIDVNVEHSVDSFAVYRFRRAGDLDQPQHHCLLAHSTTSFLQPATNTADKL